MKMKKKQKKQWFVTQCTVQKTVTLAAALHRKSVWQLKNSWKSIQISTATPFSSDNGFASADWPFSDHHLPEKENPSSFPNQITYAAIKKKKMCCSFSLSLFWINGVLLNRLRFLALSHNKIKNIKISFNLNNYKQINSHLIY